MWWRLWRWWWWSRWWWPIKRPGTRPLSMAVSTTKSTTTTNKETRLSFYAIERKWRNLLLLFSAFAVSTTHLKKKWFFEKKWPAFFCFCRFHYNFCFYQKSFFEQTKMADLLLPLLSPLEIKIKSFPRKKWRTFSFLCRVHYKINKKKCSFSSKKKMAGLLLPYPFLFWMELQ